MPSKVAGSTVRARARRLRDIGAAKATAFRAGQQGLRHRALVLEDGWTGVTGNYLKVRFDRKLERNQWAEVEVVETDLGEFIVQLSKQHNCHDIHHWNLFLLPLMN